MRFTILVADDEKNIREGLGAYLELDGYDAILASDGKEAIQEIERSGVDLLITDLRMPALSGGELLKIVASRYPSIPVIVLTGHGTVEDAVEAMRNGAYD